LQFLHETDLLEVLRHTTLDGPHGTFNVAGDGVLMLSQAVRRLGRPSLPMPSFAANTVGSMLRQSKIADFSPEQMAFLTYGRGVDTTRMRNVLGFEPDYTTHAAFEDFGRSVEPGAMSAERVATVESMVAEALGGSRG
jgi:UDP-glucose 4-epimerase